MAPHWTSVQQHPLGRNGGKKALQSPLFFLEIRESCVALGAVCVESDQPPLLLLVVFAKEGFAILVRADHNGTGRSHLN